MENPQPALPQSPIAKPPIFKPPEVKESKNKLVLFLIFLLMAAIGMAGYFGLENYQLKLKQRATDVQSLPSPVVKVDEIAKEIVEIKLIIEAPFSIATLMVDEQGNINYEASTYGNKEKFTKNEEGKIIGLTYDETQEGVDKVEGSVQITTDQFEELTGLIEASEFFSFEEEYVEENLMDATTYTIVVKRDDEEKAVSCSGKCPEKLIEIRDKIRELWGEEIVEIGV